MTVYINGSIHHFCNTYIPLTCTHTATMYLSVRGKPRSSDSEHNLWSVTTRTGGSDVWNDVTFYR